MWWASDLCFGGLARDNKKGAAFAQIDAAAVAVKGLAGLGADGPQGLKSRGGKVRSTVDAARDDGVDQAACNQADGRNKGD